MEKPSLETWERVQLKLLEDSYRKAVVARIIETAGLPGDMASVLETAFTAGVNVMSGIALKMARKELADRAAKVRL